MIEPPPKPNRNSELEPPVERAAKSALAPFLFEWHRALIVDYFAQVSQPFWHLRTFVNGTIQH